FFQAEDGIRDKLVTGVQTCALPISGARAPAREGAGARAPGCRELTQSARRPGRRTRRPGATCRLAAVAAQAPVPQLRPLGIGEILDVGIKITTRHWWTLARAVLVVVVPLQLVAAIVDVSASGGVVTTTGDTTTINESQIWTVVGGALVAVILTLLA